MFWNESKREYQPHPDCRCGQGDDWKLRGINRPCYCSFLSPLDGEGKVISYPLMEGLRKALGASSR